LRRLQAAPKLVLFIPKRKKDLQDARYQGIGSFHESFAQFLCSRSALVQTPKSPKLILARGLFRFRDKSGVKGDLL